MRFEEMNCKTQIERYRSLIGEQKDEIYKKQIIIDSLTSSLVKSVQMLFANYSTKMLSSALVGQKEDADEKDKNMFKFVTDDLNERLCIKVKFSIKAYGHDNYAYGFYFMYNNIHFELKVPNVKKANAENLYYMDYGAYHLCYEEKPHIWNTIATSYELDDFKDIIAKFVME